MRHLALFDLDNTLIDRQRALDLVITDLCADLGLGGEAERWLLTALRERAYPNHFAEFRERFAVIEPSPVLWDRYCEGLAGSVHCPPAVLVGLDRLRAAEWRVGIATNGAADIQRAKLQRTGIFERVDAICVSGEYGVQKPSALLFEEAARRCGVNTGRGGWMIGDNPVNDVAGGHAAGLRTVWVSGGRTWPNGSPHPDHTVVDARAAIELLLDADLAEEESW